MFGMTEAKLFSRRELCAISKAPDDAVQFWLRQDLLRSVERGDRKHRRFNDREVKLAALFAEARLIGLNIAAMRAIAAKLREVLAIYDLLPPTPHLAEVFLAAAKRDNGDFYHFAEDGEWDSVTDQEAALMNAAVAAIPPGVGFDLFLAQGFIDANDAITLFRTPDEEWKTCAGLPSEYGLPASSWIAFDFGRIFDLSWPNMGEDVA